MSRFANKPIRVEGVKIEVSGVVVSVSGKLGSAQVKLSDGIEVRLDGNVLYVTAGQGSDVESKYLGLNWALIRNAVVGVTTGYSQVLELVGVGYRVAKEGDGLLLSLGYSHPIVIQPKQGILFEVEGQTKIHVKGVDKALVGQVASEIKKNRPVEPYKGKGIRHEGQFVRRKAGKGVK